MLVIYNYFDFTLLYFYSVLVHIHCGHFKKLNFKSQQPQTQLFLFIDSSRFINLFSSSICYDVKFRKPIKVQLYANFKQLGRKILKSYNFIIICTF